jgi:hypothetical protein
MASPTAPWAIAVIRAARNPSYGTAMGENSRKSIQGKSLQSPDRKNILVFHTDLLRSLKPERISQDGEPMKNILLAVEMSGRTRSRSK